MNYQVIVLENNNIFEEMLRKENFLEHFNVLFIKNDVKLHDHVDMINPVMVIIGNYNGVHTRQEICKKLRSISPSDAMVLIVLVSTRAPGTIIRCLEAGADHVITDISDQAGVMRLLWQLIKREPIARDNDAAAHVQQPLTIDPARMRACWGDTSIPLTRSCFGLLRIFIRNPDSPVSSRELWRQLTCNGSHANMHSLDTALARLRASFQVAGLPSPITTAPDGKYILTARAVGVSSKGQTA